MKRVISFSAACFVFCFVAFPAFCLTLSEIRTAVRLYINDNDTSNQRFSDTQLNIIINQGHRDAALKTLLLESTSSFSLTSGTTCYALPSDIMHIKRVTHKDKVLDQKSIAGLDALNSKWELTTGDPLYYYVFRSTQVCFYPAPVSTSTGTAKVYYTYQPNLLSTDADEPFNGLDSAVAYHDVITWWSVYQCDLAERRTAEAQVFFNMYVTTVEQMRGVFFLSPDYHPNFSGRPRP